MYHWLAHHHRVPNAKSYNYMFGDIINVLCTLIFPKAVVTSYSLGGVAFVHCCWSSLFPAPFVFSGLGAGSSGVAVIKQVLGIRDFLSHLWYCESLISGGAL